MNVLAMNDFDRVVEPKVSGGGNWLYQEGYWFILARPDWGDHMSHYTHNSLIWHQCPKAREISRKVGFEYKGCWRIQDRSMNMPCGFCEEICPEGLQGLWRLHNWDRI